MISYHDRGTVKIYDLLKDSYCIVYKKVSGEKSDLANLAKVLNKV